MEPAESGGGGGGGGGDSPLSASVVSGGMGGGTAGGGGLRRPSFLHRSSTDRASKEPAALTCGTRVAVKALQPHCSADAALMLQAEARLLASLSHPNIVGFVGAGVWSAACGRPFVVQECIDGGTLQDKVVHRMTRGPRAKSSYSLDAALAWGADVAAGLAYLHARAPPIAHRDLKLENILLTGDVPPGRAHQRAVLADFGLARALTPGEGGGGGGRAGADPRPAGAVESLIGAKARVRGLAPTACTGSFIYMAPEVLKGQAYGVPADIFSLAIVLHELLSGVLTSAVVVGPTFNPRAGEAYARKVAGGFRRALPAGLPPALVALIEACWAADPAARPTAAAAHSSLVAIAAGAASGATGGGGPADSAGAFTPGGGVRQRPSAAAGLDRLNSRSSAGDGGSSGVGGVGGAGGPPTPGCMACSVM